MSKASSALASLAMANMMTNGPYGFEGCEYMGYRGLRGETSYPKTKKVPLRKTNPKEYAKRQHIKASRKKNRKRTY